jgi:hypothetical protein
VSLLMYLDNMGTGVPKIESRVSVKCISRSHPTPSQRLSCQALVRDEQAPIGMTKRQDLSIIFGVSKNQHEGGVSSGGVKCCTFCAAA